ncbi:MAG: SMI1/KNR4 family protein [Pleurocapsa sp. MO_226.B13]|nr:SMI1/KNR4 family protein [Pleurocapsa sp. MO_226.B13]
MTNTKLIDSQYLSDLGQKIQKLPPDEASPLLLEASTIILFAGFPEIAYQGFLKLRQGELKVSQVSILVDPIKAIIPALCYLMKIPCPSIFSEQEMSLNELEQYINKNFREYERVYGIDRWFLTAMPSGNWSEEFLYDLTHPKVNVKGESRFKLNDFFQDLHRVISQCYVNRGQWQEASRWLKVFEDVLDAWELDRISYVEQEILVFGIRTYLNLKDISSADRFIYRWWQSLESLTNGLYLVAYLPDLMKRISEGVLQNKINLSQEQAQEFLDLVNTRNYIPTNIGFIPTVEDWNNFLEKWNTAIFDNIEEEDLDDYEFEYSDVLNRKSCLRTGATEEEIAQLETKLTAKLPLSYRNFLLASNGFTILNEYCQLYGTDDIKWFVEENRDWAEIWEDRDDLEDEKYFQYGEHQDCCWIGGRYLKTALQISSTEDGYVFLLNPKIIDSRNEWEAWDFGNKYPGAYRYRSFWEMMQKVYKSSFASRTT